MEIQKGGFLRIGQQTGGGLTIGVGSNLIVDAGGGFLSSGPIENDGNITLNLGTFFGTFGGAGSITKLGGGVVTFQAVLSNLANVFVDDGTFIDSSTSIGTVVVTGPNSILRVNSGITLGTTPTVNSGGTVDNFGNITAGVVSEIGPGNVINETGGQLTNQDGDAILFTGGGKVTNDAGGVISGTGGLAIAISGGPGTLINSGAINGSVTLGNSVNTVQLFTGSKITGDLNLGSNAGSDLILDGSGAQTISQAVTGTITNTGSLTKQGSGTWTIDTLLNAPVGTNVTAGALLVEGTLASAQTVVNPGALLGGHGTIEGNLVNNGTVGQGNSPGTLTVTGNYTQGAGGLLRIGVGGLASGQHDLLAVGGSAAVAGTLQFIRLGNFNLQPGDQVTFLTAKNGITGTFAPSRMGCRAPAPS